ncbi:MAG: hypothetical protein M3O62_00285 [Pseudomonadota bacterium]|nr:hypothetical protein [Pseudomonadota bacterium]
MNTPTDNDLPLGTIPHYANMHKWLQRGLFVCLVVLVIEASLSLPLIAVWMGWPTLSMTEICHEMTKVRYSNDNAECKVPHPLFDPSEGFALKDSAQDLWGIQPRPLYKRIGYRDLVKFRDERLAREASARAKNAETAMAPAAEQPTSPNTAGD